VLDPDDYSLTCACHFLHFDHQDDLSERSFTKNGYVFTRTPVKGMMTSENILTACTQISQKPACDYQSYADGKCSLAGYHGTALHLSYPPHNDQYEIPRNKTLGAYFYSGAANGQWSLLNQGYNHRWSGVNDRDGDTFCVKKTGTVATTFVHLGHTLMRTRVDGSMTSSNIRKACAKLGFRPVCNYASMMDGKCVVVSNTGNWYFSNPSQNRQYDIPRDVVKGAYFYSGTDNAHWSYQNTGTSQRW
jgi:hypothetical protein